MKEIERVPQSLQITILAVGIFATMLGADMDAMAQEFEDLQTPESPLMLEARGSFFVGGETVEQTSVELGSFGPDDQITINQMYVEFMYPTAPRRCPWSWSMAQP